LNEICLTKYFVFVLLVDQTQRAQKRLVNVQKTFNVNIYR